MSTKADQIVRLTQGHRYDVAALDARLIRVSWTRGDGSSEDHEGYDWGYYFAEDGTYAGPDCHGIEPEFVLTGEDPVAIRSEVSIPVALVDAIEARDLEAIEALVRAAWLSLSRPTPTPDQAARLRAARSIYEALGGDRVIGGAA